MKTRQILCAILLLVSTNLSAAVDQLDACIEKWPIYVFTKNGHSITLIPSNHIAVFQLCPEVLEKLIGIAKNVKQIVFEADLSAILQQSKRMKHDGQDWPNGMTEKSIISSEKLLRHLGVEYSIRRNIRSLKPIYIHFVLSGLALTGTNEPRGPSMDTSATDVAKSSGNVVNYLESSEEQYHFMEQISLEEINHGMEQIHKFFVCYECRERYATALRKNFTNFSEGGFENLKTMWNISDAYVGFPLAQVDQEIVESRNSSMAKKILSYANTDETAIYLGTAHFWGRQSIITFLQQEIRDDNNGNLVCLQVSKNATETSTPCAAI